MAITIDHQTNAIIATSGSVTINGGIPNAITATASGAITAGNPVVLNVNGTVSAVAITPAGAGAGGNFNANQHAEQPVVINIPGTSTVVVAYRNQSDSSRGYAQVGTVTGTTVTWGTRTLFNSQGYTGAFGISMCYDTVNNKVVIVYQQDTSPGYAAAVVGTISGTSISFGTPVTLEAIYTAIYSCCFDESSGKVFIATSNFSSQNKAFIGTVSGTTISFGTPVTIHTRTTSGAAACCYLANIQRVLVTYPDWGNRNYLRVGTISGTTVTFGAEIIYDASLPSYGSGPRVFYDTTTTKTILYYQRSTTPNTKFLTVLDVISDSSITFNTPVELTGSVSALGYDSVNSRLLILNGSTFSYSQVSANTFNAPITPISYGVSDNIGTYTAVTYNPNQQRVVPIATQSAPSGGRGFGYSLIPVASQNLTATNFIGTSLAAYADTATATVVVAGGVSTNQSGLTPGLLYYVQPSGTLATTPGSPSVIAGTAITDTRLLVR